MRTNEQTPDALSEQHVAYSCRTGLTDETTWAAGLATLSASDVARVLGLDDVCAGLAIPYPNSTFVRGGRP